MGRNLNYGEAFFETEQTDSRAFYALINTLETRSWLWLLRFACDEYRQTIIMVTHDAAMADYADRILRIRDGVVNKDTADRAGSLAALAKTFPGGEPANGPDGRIQPASPGREPANEPPFGLPCDVTRTAWTQERESP